MKEEFKDIEGKLAQLSKHELSSKKDSEILKVLHKLQVEEEFTVAETRKNSFFSWNLLRPLFSVMAAIIILLTANFYFNSYEYHLGKAEVALFELQNLIPGVEANENNSQDANIQLLVDDMLISIQKAILAAEKINDVSELEVALTDIRDVQKAGAQFFEKTNGVLKDVDTQRVITEALKSTDENLVSLELALNQVAAAKASGSQNFVINVITTDERPKEPNKSNVDTPNAAVDDKISVDNSSELDEISSCGNAILESGETCDDGNRKIESCLYGLTSCFVCDDTCHFIKGSTHYCGDGDLDSLNGEQCDDGNTNNGDGCSSSCQTEPLPASVCGNGVVEAGEQCDDGNVFTEACDYGKNSCSVCGSGCKVVSGATAYCGDGILQKIDGEACDDGNNYNGDGCGYDCIIENNGSICGNGSLELGEVCDDGNLVTEQCDYGDPYCFVCSKSCDEVPGFTSYCGDGGLDSFNGEQCDDGNTKNGDGCSFSCQAEQLPVLVCGNSLVEAGEQCDDGNTKNGDGCSSSCQIEDEPETLICGNGILDFGEFCDDGNTNTEVCPYGETFCFVCNSSCDEVPGFTSYCGDGDLDPLNGEQCDDANTENADGCSSSCQLE